MSEVSKRPILVWIIFIWFVVSGLLAIYNFYTTNGTRHHWASIHTLTYALNDMFDMGMCKYQLSKF